jgi:hypothetical protein
MVGVVFKVLGIRFRSRKQRYFLLEAKGGSIVNHSSTSHIDE